MRNGFKPVVLLILLLLVCPAISCAGGNCENMCQDTCDECDVYASAGEGSCYNLQYKTCQGNSCGVYHPLKVDCLFTCQWDNINCYQCPFDVCSLDEPCRLLKADQPAEVCIP